MTALGGVLAGYNRRHGSAWGRTYRCAGVEGTVAMRGIEGEQVLLRLIFGESRHLNHKPLFRVILELLREEGVAGTTVFKGIAGFGHGGHIHTIALEVASSDLPLVIEIVDTQEHIDRVLPKLAPLMEGGVIMLERAHVIRYAKSDPPSA